MKVWKNTSTLDGYDEGLIFTGHEDQADIALLGSKPITITLSYAKLPPFMLARPPGGGKYRGRPIRFHHVGAVLGESEAICDQQAA